MNLTVAAIVCGPEELSPQHSRSSPKQGYGLKPPTHRGKHKRVGDFSFISLWHPIVRRALGDSFRCGINSNMMGG
jgi:hypothetical protein